MYKFVKYLTKEKYIYFHKNIILTSYFEIVLQMKEYSEL